MISDDKIEAALDYIRDHGNEYAIARAQRVYLEEYRKTLKATLMQEKDGPGHERESFAYAHPDYRDHLDGLRAAVEQEERIKWMLTAAQAKIEVWRTQQANTRRGV